MDFRIFEDFTSDLKENWEKLYQEKGGGYNSSYEWCHTWFKHFGKDKDLFVITGWQDEEIRLIAPFYKKKNRLYVIGTYPDFYDGLEILCSCQEDLLHLVDYIIKNKFEMDFRFIISDSNFFKYLLRRLEQENIHNIKIYGYTLKPLICGNEENKKRLKIRLKKRNNIAKREFNDELKYDFNTDKDKKYIEEFVNFHKNKWDTFKSSTATDFITDLYFNSNIAILSRFYLKNSNESIAYEFKYRGSDNVLYKSVFSFNNDYSSLSPGICILCYDLSENIKYIEHGRGCYGYKYLYTDKEDAVLCVKADLTWKRHKNIYYPLKAFKQRILDLF